MKHTVCVVTGSRAEYGLLHPLLVRLQNDNDITLWIVVTGSHLSRVFGNTQNEIEKDGFILHRLIPLSLEDDSKVGMVQATGEALSAFADYFSKNCPDLLIVLGDRYEIFAAATAAAMFGIPIAHLHGGETTEGAVDEFLRHSITKMSTLHFVACEQYRRRVIQLGEAPERVFNVGALGVENSLNMPLMALPKLQESIGFQLEGKSFSVVTFHPVTLGDNTPKAQIWELVRAMEAFPEMNYIITKANADAGGRTINQIWAEESVKHGNWLVISSLGAQRYLSALRYAKMMIGNSSSGIIEGPAMKIPTVNIGDRQKGRMMADSVICCEPRAEDIISAMKRALSQEFKAIAAEVVSPFGDGHTSEKIFNTIKQYLMCAVSNTKKKFYDVKVMQ